MLAIGKKILGLARATRVLAGAALVRVGARLIAKPVGKDEEPSGDVPEHHPVVTYGERASEMRATTAPRREIPPPPQPLAGSAEDRFKRARGY